MTARDGGTNRRRRVVVIGVAAGVGVLGLAGWLIVAFSSMFAVAAVDVTGTKLLTVDAVRQAAAVQPGASLALVDTAAVAGRVGELPPVAEARVSRQWPTTLRIEVTERTARLAIRSGAGYLLADATGVVFNTVASAPNGLVTVVVDPKNAALISDAGTVFNALDPAVQKKVREIDAPTRDSITVVLTTGVRVVWGDASQSELKSQVLDALVGRNVSVIDVSAPSNPATR